MPSKEKLEKLDRILAELPLHITTDASWAALAVDNLDGFLLDHASCERKAHAAAMMLANRYPDRPQLQDLMLDLALEELQHFRQVLLILRRRGLVLGPDTVDEYVKALMKLVRHPLDQHLLDRLLVAAVIEIRSAERFCLIAQKLTSENQGQLAEFYCDFALEEARHGPMFLALSRDLFDPSRVSARWREILAFEAAVVSKIAIRPTVH